MDEVKVPDRVSFQTFPHCSAWNFTADLNDHAPTWVPLQVVVDEFGSRGGAVGPTKIHICWLMLEKGATRKWNEQKQNGKVWHSLMGIFFVSVSRMFLGRCFPALPRWSTAGLGRELGCEGEGRSCHKKGTINIHKLPWTASSKINKCYCHFKGKCHFDRSSRNNSVNHFVGSTLFGSLMHVMPRWKQLDSTSQRPQWRRKSAFFLKKTRQPTSLLRKSGATPQICWPYLARPPL